jgi:hypothetical protein
MTGLMFNKFRNVITTRASASADRERDYLQTFDEMLDHAAKFVFPDMPYNDMHTFSYQLLNAGLLALPFETCFFQHKDAHGLFCVQTPETKEYIHILGTWKANDRFYGPLPVWFNTTTKEVILPYHLQTTEHEQDWEHRAPSLAAAMGSCIAFLNTKGTKLERVAPTDGVNAKRERQGKRPIPEYTVVKIDPEIIKTYMAQGGTHASPRPHLRRGHLATIYRGTDNERKIVKPPCFVNATDNLPPPPQYKVEKAKPPASP